MGKIAKQQGDFRYAINRLQIGREAYAREKRQFSLWRARVHKSAL